MLFFKTPRSFPYRGNFYSPPLAQKDFILFSSGFPPNTSPSLQRLAHLLKQSPHLFVFFHYAKYLAVTSGNNDLRGDRLENVQKRVAGVWKNLETVPREVTACCSQPGTFLVCAC